MPVARIDSIPVQQGGASVGGVTLIVVLIIVAVIITGAGLHSSEVWVILASVSILCLAFCSCMKCRHRVSRWRRASQQSDAVSTISDGSDILADMLYPRPVTPPVLRDSPPSYSAVMTPDHPPPPYSALIHYLSAARTSVTSFPEDTETPPPYSHVATPDVVAAVTNPVARTRPTASDLESISIISSSDGANKHVTDIILGDIAVNCDSRTFDLDRVNEDNEGERTSSC